MRIRCYRFTQGFRENTKDLIHEVMVDALTDRLAMDFIWKSYLNYDLMTVADNNYKYLFHQQTKASISLSIFQTAWIAALQDHKVNPDRLKINYGYFHDDVTGENYLLVDDTELNDCLTAYDGMFYDSIASSGMVENISTRIMPQDESFALWKKIFKGASKLADRVPLSISISIGILLSPPMTWRVDKSRALMFPGEQSRISALADLICHNSPGTDFDLLLKELEDTLDRTAGWKEILYMDQMIEPLWLPGVGNSVNFRTLHHNFVAGIYE